MGSWSGLGERVAGLVQGPFRNGRPLRVRAGDYHSPQTSLQSRAHKDVRSCAQIATPAQRQALPERESASSS